MFELLKIALTIAIVVRVYLTSTVLKNVNQLASNEEEKKYIPFIKGTIIFLTFIFEGSAYFLIINYENALSKNVAMAIAIIFAAAIGIS